MALSVLDSVIGFSDADDRIESRFVSFNTLTEVIINSAIIVCFCISIKYVHEDNVIYSYLKTSKCRIFLMRLFDLQSFVIAPSGL
jgi:hypothetical protein